MMTKYTKLSTIAGVALLVGCETEAEAAPNQAEPQQAPAQQEQQAQPEQGEQQSPETGKTGQQEKTTDSGQQAQMGMERTTQIHGTIADKKVVHIRGKQSGQHQVLLLQMKDGTRVVADLGPAQKLGQMDLSKGQQIDVMGHPARVGDRVVLFAERVRIDGETTEITRPEEEKKRRAKAQKQAQRRSQDFQDQGERKDETIKGTVRRHKDVGIQGEDSSNKVVLLETKDGRTFAVDLGPAGNLEDVQIAEGTPIAVKGTLVEVDNRLVMMAKELDLGEQQVDIQRSEMQARAQQKAGGKQ